MEQTDKQKHITKQIKGYYYLNTMNIDGVIRDCSVM